MKFKKANDIEWINGDFRIIRVEGLDSPTYDCYWNDNWLGNFSSWHVAKMACADKARMLGVAA